MLWGYVMSLTEICMTPIRKLAKRLIVQLQVLAAVGQEVHSAPKAALWQGLPPAVGGIAGGLLLGVAGSSLRKWVIDITDVGE